MCRQTPEFMMILATRILVGMFLVGMVGSVFVLVLSAIDDFRVLFGRGDHEAMKPADIQATGKPGA